MPISKGYAKDKCWNCAGLSGKKKGQHGNICQLTGKMFKMTGSLFRPSLRRIITYSLGFAQFELSVAFQEEQLNAVWM